MPLVTGCTNNLYRVKKMGYHPVLQHSVGNHTYRGVSDSTYQQTSSFLYTDKNGNQIIFNEAIRDQNSGDIMGHRYLNQVIISAKSNTVAEREGIVNIDFVIKIPEALMSSNWQIDIQPVVSSDHGSWNLKRILLSGREFKRAQERGYKRFERYLSGIIPEDADIIEAFAMLANLTIFLERHLPGSLILDGINNDTLSTQFGVSEKMIVDKYLKKWQIEKNTRKREATDLKFSKYIRNPYLSDARLDSVVKNRSGEFEYHYREAINAKKSGARLSLSTEAVIRNSSGLNVTLIPSDTIVYNITSISSLIDTTTRYIKYVREKRVTKQTEAHFRYSTGGSSIDSALSDNLSQLKRVAALIDEIEVSREYLIDTIIITSSSSPDGPFVLNCKLSDQRGEKIKEYLQSIIKEPAFFVVYSLGEDWQRLMYLIKNDTIIKHKEPLFQVMNIENPDIRESEIKKNPDYLYLKSELYPKLRRVTFTFMLSRTDMEKDTVHTTSVDTLYMQAIRLMKEKEYLQALEILVNYNDINTAIAALSAGNPEMAEDVLSGLISDAHTHYLRAIAASALGDEHKAIFHFLKSKEYDIRMAYRGGLDPEISSLINKYNLNRDLFD